MQGGSERPVAIVAVRSRHPEDYVLRNRADGSAWRVDVTGIEPRWVCVDPDPVAVLVQHAQGLLPHRTPGLCPTPDRPWAAVGGDPDCPVCMALLSLGRHEAAAAEFHLI